MVASGHFNIIAISSALRSMIGENKIPNQHIQDGEQLKKSATVKRKIKTRRPRRDALFSMPPRQKQLLFLQLELKLRQSAAEVATAAISSNAAIIPKRRCLRKSKINLLTLHK